jgi:hypothetical protein
MSKLPDPRKSLNSSNTAYQQGNANRRIENSTISPPRKIRPDFDESVYERGADQFIGRIAQPQPSPSLIPAGSSLYATSEGSQYTGPPPSSVSGYTLGSDIRPADRRMSTANQYVPPASPPWRFRPEFGRFIYKRSTDQIIRPNAQPQPRPSHISADSLSYAIWEPFQYTGPPQKFNNGYVPQPGFGVWPPVGGVQANQTRTPQGNPSQPRTIPGDAGQPSNLSTQEVTQRLSNFSLAPKAQGNDAQTTQFQRNGQLLKHTVGPRKSVATLGVAPTQTAARPPRGQAKDPRGDIKFPGYKMHPANFFMVGRAFLVLWAEPTGGTAVTKMTKFEVVNQLGQRVYSKARRFVVIREGAQSCHALPITTYGGRGVAKERVVKADHAIIYTGEVAPSPSSGESPGPGEAPMRPFPIRVNWDDPSEKLDPMSRINFGGVTLVQHNVMTKNCGMVNKNSLAALKMQFSNVFNQQPEAAEKAEDEDEENDDEGSKKDENEEVEEDEDEGEDGSKGGEADEDNEDEDEDEDEDDYESESESEHGDAGGVQEDEEMDDEAKEIKEEVEDVD